MADQSLELGAYLAKLEEQRARLDIIIADVRRELGLAVENGQVAIPASFNVLSQAGGREPIQTGRIRPDEFFGMSIPEAVKAYLAIMKQPQGPKAIVDGLTAGGLLTNAKYFYANVTTALKRLRASGQVMLTPNGWGLASWYPNRAKVTPDKKKGRGKRRKFGVKSPKRVVAPTALKPEAAHPNGSAPKPGNDYRTFMAERRKAGMMMADVAAEWRRLKAGGS